MKSEPLTPPPENAGGSHIGIAVAQHSKRIENAPKVPGAIVAVVGVGYVGFQLVVTFARKYSVIAYDINQARLDDVAPYVQGKSVYCTSDAQDLSAATHFLVAVPTALYHDRRVDDRALRRALHTVGHYAAPHSTIVVESSVAVGTTRALVEPLMRAKGFKAGMSPERLDPGRSDPPFEIIPKIISGLDSVVPDSLSSIHALYSAVFAKIVSVSNPEVAEMTKLYENCQRMICIAYANEMADACIAHGIDAHEVIAAAATKPFGYNPYMPGLGVGGHCIPVNPYYLLENCDFPLLEAATRKMWERPAKIGDRIMAELSTKLAKAVSKESHKSNNACTQSYSNSLKSRPRILVVGVAFKRGQSVTSHSPGLALISHLLSNYDVYVEYADPLVPQDHISFVPKLNEDTDWNVENLQLRFDVIVVAVDQEGLDIGVLKKLGQKVLIEDFTHYGRTLLSSSCGYLA